MPKRSRANAFMPIALVCVAPSGFEKELALETGSNDVRGQLVFLDSNLKTDFSWAQNTWMNPQQIEFTSISDAARKLRDLGPFWSLHSTSHHRRAALIQEKLPVVKRPPMDFLGALPKVPLGSWTLLDEHTLLAASNCTSRFPDGAVTFNESKTAPSRAYLKLWELFTTESFHPSKTERCLELGAAPGGWTWVLATLGSKVLAVDRADLARHVKQMANVETVQRNAFTLKPEDVGPIDWLFSDLICYLKDLYDLVMRWRESGLCRNFVCTLKFRGETDFATTELFQKIPSSTIRHLSVNKHELTWWLRA